MASSRPAVVLHTTPPLAPLPASDAESIRLLCTLRLGGVRAGVETAEWSANGEFRGSECLERWPLVWSCPLFMTRNYPWQRHGETQAMSRPVP